jgi:hypothetical protein
MALLDHPMALNHPMALLDYAYAVAYNYFWGTLFQVGNGR